MITHIPHLDVGMGRQCGALTLFPVWIDEPGVSGFDWTPTPLIVNELDESDVNTLAITNVSERPVVLLEGDLLLGGLQNRMAATSSVIRPQTSASVDVLCVEEHRWFGTRHHLASSRRASLSVRQGNLAGRVRGERIPQGEVWGRIRRYQATMPSPTSSMVDHLDGLADEPMRLVEGQRGVIIGISGLVVGMELFGSRRALTSRWTGIVRAAQLDAQHAPVVGTSSRDARHFARVVQRTSLLPLEPNEFAIPAQSGRGPISISALHAARTGGLMHLAAFENAHPMLAVA